MQKKPLLHIKERKFQRVLEEEDGLVAFLLEEGRSETGKGGDEVMRMPTKKGYRNREKEKGGG